MAAALLRVGTGEDADMAELKQLVAASGKPTRPSYPPASPVGLLFHSAGYSEPLEFIQSETAKRRLEKDRAEREWSQICKLTFLP